MKKYNWKSKDLIYDTPQIRTCRKKGYRRKTVKGSWLYVWRVHRWLDKKYGKANKCENKECDKESKKYEWAKKTGYEYEKNKNNFLMLCKKCHVKYDFTEEWSKNISKGKKGIKRKCPWMIERNKRKDIIEKIKKTKRKKKNEKYNLPYEPN